MKSTRRTRSGPENRVVLAAEIDPDKRTCTGKATLPGGAALGLKGSHDLGRELPLSGLREELSVREEPHPRVMSADQLLYNKARRRQRARVARPSGKASSEGRVGEPGGSPQAGRGGSVTGSREHLPKAKGAAAEQADCFALGGPSYG